MAYRTSKETQERKDLKKKHIIDTSIRVFAENGYYATSVKSIVDAAEVSVGTFYFYFKNKEDLFEILYDELSDQFYEALCKYFNNIDVEVDRDLSKAITFLLLVIEKNQSLAKILFIEAVGLNPSFELNRAKVMNKFTDYATFYFEQMYHNKQISVPDTRIAAVAFIGALNNVVMDWLLNNSNHKLTDSVYGLAIYNLQALGICYKEDQVRAGISEILLTM